MTLPQLMIRIWDGDPNEYFTFLDMRRVEYNANIIAREAGVDQVTFLEVTRASQFRYDEAQKLENLILASANAVGVQVTIEDAWSYNRTVSFADFERWEANTFTVYQELGGVGERIPSDKKLVTVSATLFADSWQGTGPYHQDLDVPSVYADTESLSFVAHTATPIQRAAEYNALLVAKTLSDRKVRVYALSIRPKVNIPIRIAMGGLQMQQIVTLPASGWQGTGPWTQTVTLSQAVTDAVIGAQEGMTDAQVEAMAEAAISVSAINGTSLTVRALYAQPEVDLPVGIMYDTAEVE